MKYCASCGAELDDNATFCSKCGKPVAGANGGYAAAPQKDNTVTTIAFVFMIVSCVTMGWFLIPLAWLIPMTLKVNRHLKNGEPLSTAFNVCVLLFANVVSGILLLVEGD